MESYSFPLARTYSTIITIIVTTKVVTIIKAIIRNFHLVIRFIILVQIP